MILWFATPWLRALAAAGLWAVVASRAFCEDTAPPQPNLAAQALLRLENVDLASNPRLREAVDRVLKQVRGTPDFVALVRRFNLTGQEEGLREVASARGGDEAGVDAVRLLLGAGQGASLTGLLRQTNLAVATRVAAALGGAGDARAVPALRPALTDEHVDAGVRRQVLKSMARYQDGASQLVGLAAEDHLPNDLKFTARTELSTVRWPEIKAAAARALPAPQAAGNEVLPPVADLLRRKGDPGRGAELFRGKATCATCHKVGGVGTDFGPDLSQVGTKLGKDALYESILDPSAGIAFGYEAWVITLRSGDDLFGLVAGETETDLTLKAPGGILTPVKKSQILKRDRQALSIMPAGLQALLSTQELVDLVEYLSTLRQQSR